MDDYFLLVVFTEDRREYRVMEFQDNSWAIHVMGDGVDPTLRPCSRPVPWPPVPGMRMRYIEEGRSKGAVAQVTARVTKVHARDSTPMGDVSAD